MRISLEETMEPKLGVAEIGQALGLSSSGVHRLIRRGDLSPAFRVAAKFVVPQSVVQQYLADTYFDWSKEIAS